MKPAKFDYYAPTTLAEATGLLKQHGFDAQIMAGGQSLMPLMNMRLARPQVLVDINRISQLDYISLTPEGGLAIGALTRLRTIERSTEAAERAPLMAAALPYIGHVQIRNRGTIGGSISHADPAAELPALSVALDAQFTLAREGSERVVNAADFFVTFFTTAKEQEEVLTEVRIPPLGPGWGWGFQEVSRRNGDFAMVGAISLIQLDDNGICQGARIVAFGVGGGPVRVSKAEEELLNKRADTAAFQAAARVVAEELDPISDIHASAEYRKEVGGTLVRRGLEAALINANSKSKSS